MDSFILHKYRSAVLSGLDRSWTAGEEMLGAIPEVQERVLAVQMERIRKN